MASGFCISRHLMLCCPCPGPVSPSPSPLPPASPSPVPPAPERSGFSRSPEAIWSSSFSITNCGVAGQLPHICIYSINASANCLEEIMRSPHCSLAGRALPTVSTADGASNGGASNLGGVLGHGWGPAAPKKPILKPSPGWGQAAAPPGFIYPPTLTNLFSCCSGCQGTDPAWGAAAKRGLDPHLPPPSCSCQS